MKLLIVTDSHGKGMDFVVIKIGRKASKVLDTVFVNEFWISKKPPVSNSGYFKADGLHLNNSGKAVLAHVWLTSCEEL